MSRRTLAIAIAACLLVAPSAHAAGHAVTLSDAQECTGATCTPDLRSLAIYYDTDATFLVSVTFYEALPAYSAASALRVRVNIGRRLAPDGASCTPVGPAGALNGEAGDIRIEVGAYDGGSSASTAANGVLYRTGSQGSFAVARSITPDRKTLTVTVTSAALAGLDLRCTQADLVDDSDAGGVSLVVRDAVALAWFPGFEPPPPATPSEDAAPATPTTTATQAGQARPSLVAVPVVRRAKKSAALLTCGTGRWKGATRFSFRWLRDARPIARASSRQYRLRRADHGHALRCRVIARNAVGSRPATSRALRIR